MYNFLMYIIELIAKLLKNKKTKKTKNFIQNEVDEVDYSEVCTHTFFPIDSTGETLACSRCGLIVKKEDEKVKPKNPFV